MLCVLKKVMVAPATLGVVLPAGGIAVSISPLEAWLRITALVVTIVSGCVAIYFHIRKNR